MEQALQFLAGLIAVRQPIIGAILKALLAGEEATSILRGTCTCQHGGGTSFTTFVDSLGGSKQDFLEVLQRKVGTKEISGSTCCVNTGAFMDALRELSEK